MAFRYTETLDASQRQLAFIEALGQRFIQFGRVE